MIYIDSEHYKDFVAYIHCSKSVEKHLTIIFYFFLNLNLQKLKYLKLNFKKYLHA